MKVVSFFETLIRRPGQNSSQREFSSFSVSNNGVGSGKERFIS